MSVPQNEKTARFRALHDGPGAFVIPNLQDVDSARILAGRGFQALAPSSAASAVHSLKSPICYDHRPCNSSVF